MRDSIFSTRRHS